MSILNLDPSSKAVLTRDVKVSDPANPPNGTLTNSFACTLLGSPLTDPTQKVNIWRNVIDGKFYARIAEKIPMPTTSAGREAAAALQALKPIHYASGDGSIVGYFVPAPDFNNRDSAGVTEVEPSTHVVQVSEASGAQAPIPVTLG